VVVYVAQKPGISGALMNWRRQLFSWQSKGGSEVGETLEEREAEPEKELV
jgi:hypothetical protein